MAKTATVQCQIDGEPYSFNIDEDYTVPVARQIKAWFPALGTYNAFNFGISQGDGDAIASLRWMILRKAGKATVEANRMPDFGGIGDFLNSWVVEGKDPCPYCEGRGWNQIGTDEPEVDPTKSPPATSPPSTPDSAKETPTNSEPSTSPDSPSPVT